MARFSTTVTAPEPVAVGAEARSEEIPGPDGIRHELVARIRQQIADGTYDTEDKWLLAEEALLRRIEECA
jgi:anti-sigma28 factor (negative regulator of flagellin synthesis)